MVRRNGGSKCVAEEQRNRTDDCRLAPPLQWRYVRRRKGILSITGKTDEDVVGVICTRGNGSSKEHAKGMPMVRDIIRSAKPAMGAAILAAALFMVPSERAAANCPWDELLEACYYTLPSSNCATGSVCDCKGEGNEFHWPCNVSYCADATPLPCGPDPQFSGRGEDSDAVAADSGSSR